MLSKNEQLIMDAILREEGGFVNNPFDRGGPTNFGITLVTLREYRNDGGLVEKDIKDLTKEQAIEIYYNRYFKPFAEIQDPWLQHLVIDTAVNNGRGRAAQWLQRACGALEDGAIGPRTLSTLNSSNQRHVYYEFFQIRMRAYGALVSQNHSQAVFVAGWLNRLGRFVHYGEA